MRPPGQTTTELPGTGVQGLSHRPHQAQDLVGPGSNLKTTRSKSSSSSILCLGMGPVTTKSKPSNTKSKVQLFDSEYLAIVIEIHEVPRNASASVVGTKLCRNQLKATSAMSPPRTNLHKPGLGVAGSLVPNSVDLQCAMGFHPSLRPQMRSRLVSTEG